MKEPIITTIAIGIQSGILWLVGDYSWITTVMFVILVNILLELKDRHTKEK